MYSPPGSTLQNSAFCSDSTFSVAYGEKQLLKFTYTAMVFVMSNKSMYCEVEEQILNILTLPHIKERQHRIQ
jgi:hypothetical protein